MHHALGRMTIDRIVELEHWPFATTDMFPAAPSGGCDRVDLQIATYLVRTPDATMLVDAGNGNDKHRPVLAAHAGFRTDYLRRIATIVPLESIDIVVCTHLHPDHCGGLTRLVEGDWVPVFPNARHVVAATELAWIEDLHATEPTEGVEADLARTYADSVLPVVRAGLLDTVTPPTTVVPGVTLRPLPGHTAGHLVVELRDEDAYAVVSGDVLHHPLQFGDLDLAQSGDADAADAAASRRLLCADLAHANGLLLPAHFAPGTLDDTGTGLRYRPLFETATTQHDSKAPEQTPSGR